MMHRFWVHAEPDAARMAESPEFVQQRLGDNSLGIISDNDRRAVLDSRLQRAHQASSQRRFEAVAHLAVDAHDLLFMGDDPGFDAGGSGDGSLQAAAAD